MDIHEFCSRLEHVKPKGDKGFIARCPHHEDKKASLSISQGEDGRILLHCFANCDPRDIVADLGLKIADLFPAGSKPPAAARKSSSSLGDIVAEYDYAFGDELVLQVVRFEPKNFRQRRPDPDKPGEWIWDLKGIKQIPLFNIDEVRGAIERGKSIFLVEGEKDVLALAKLGLYATTCVGGAGKWRSEYRDQLEGARIVVLPDNDPPGRDHALKISRLLPDVTILELPGLPPKGDVSDWIAQGGTRADLITLARDAQNRRDETPAPPPPGVDFDFPPFRVLGYHEDRLYFYVKKTCQVLSYSHREMGKDMAMCFLAPASFWETYDPALVGDKGPDWKSWAKRLITLAQQRYYQPGRIRGRGAWLDGDRVVLHLGDRLVVDGAPTDLAAFDSQYVYSRGEQYRLPYHAPATDTDGMLLQEICSRLPWERSAYAALLAGWIALAPICGVLRWRPHCWVTGPSGSGKSWIMNNIVCKMLQDVAVHVQSATTEAGIRQYLGRDARPVLFDEAEMEDLRGQERMQRVLELARQASSDSGTIIKGGQSGLAQSFEIRSMFMLASIGMAIKRRADETRVTVLSLRRPELRSEESTKRFQDTERMVERTLTSEFAAAIIARSCSMAPTIAANSATFAIAIANELGSRRAGDQLGTLMAGYWSLWRDGQVGLDEAREVVNQHNLADCLPDDRNADEIRCLDYLMEQRVRVELTEGRPAVERSIGELIDVCRRPGGYSHYAADAADATLRRNGIRFDGDGLLVAVQHSGIACLLTGTPWAHDWAVHLGRMNGAQSGRSVPPVTFPGRNVQRCVRIPLPGDVERDEAPAADVPIEHRPAQLLEQDEIPFN